MTVQRQATYWLIAFVLLLIFLYVFSGILLPFIAGMVVAYLLDPLADKLETWKFSRLWATLTILLLFVFIFLFALLLVVPLAAQQLTEFISRIPGFVQSIQGFLVSDSMQVISGYLPIDVGDIRSVVDQFVANGSEVLAKLLNSILTGGQLILDVLSLLVITPVVAFYLLYDWDDMVATINGWLPRDHASVIRRLVSEMADMIAGFVRAQGLLCAILGIFYAVALSAAGLNFGLLIGIGIGVVSFIPFVGAILGAILSVGVALAQFLPEQNYIMIVVIIAIFGFGQFLEGNILQPRLMGHHVQLHPVWLMFALFAFGSLLGFVGMLVAIPAAACIGVLVRFGIERYLESRLYLGTKPPDEAS